MPIDQNLKEKYIMQIRRLPEQILKLSYHIELVDKKVLCQHDAFVEDKYREFRIVNDKPDDLDDILKKFQIGEWKVSFEVED